MAEVPAPERFVEVLGPAVRQAAAIARALEGRVRNRPKASEPTLVKQALTLADTASQEAVLVPLLEHFPDVALAAEEDTPSVASFPAESRARVVVDPIDGTLHSYLEERGPYACMVGLAIDGVYEAALVGLPREGLFFDGVRGGGARRFRPRSGKPKAWRAEATGPRVIVSHELPEPILERLREAGFEVAFGCGGAISVAPLVPGVRAGLRVAKPGQGISIRGRIGVAISRAAGAVVWNGEGEPFPETVESPDAALIVAADAADARTLADAVR